MFGYVVPNRPEMKVKDLERYRSYYCGLCHTLENRRGIRGQVLLSYDCTFVVLLLTGVYEPLEKQELRRCGRHALMKHPETVNRFTPYAADMNILLGYLKAQDDWQDEQKPSARMMLHTYRKDYLNVRKMWPGQERAVRLNVRRLGRIEKEPLPQDEESVLSRLDEASGCCGAFLGEICAPYRDEWQEDLKGVGFYLGKFIYIMDAWNDIRKDEEKGNYNLLAVLQKMSPEHFREKVREILMDTAACCCRFFERLPIVKNVEILRNILYSGIWVKWNEGSV